tara:strand:- start:212 stop:706 length:495 start_codon:yes stop_codon:yes gene_type:complete
MTAKQKRPSKKKPSKIDQQNDILNKQKNNIKFSKSHSKFINRLRGMGNPKKLTHLQLSKLAQGFSVKYAVHLETMIGELLRDKKTLMQTLEWQITHIEWAKNTINATVDKYEILKTNWEKANEDLAKENTQLILSFEELKVRHFGKLTGKLKEFALRPSKKKDN